MDARAFRQAGRTSDAHPPRRWRLAPAVIAAWLTLGCAIAPPGPPAGFAPGAATFTASSLAPQVALDGDVNKPWGSAWGALWGGGLGMALGYLSEHPCDTTGFVNLCGLGTLAGAVTGVLAGAIIGAIVTDSGDVIDARRAVLATAATSQPFAQQLAATLQERARPIGDGAAPPRWTVELGALRVEAVGHNRGRPFGLKLAAPLQITPVGAGPARIEAERVYAATCPGRLDAKIWTDHDSATLAQAIGRCVPVLAEQVLGALSARD